MEFGGVTPDKLRSDAPFDLVGKVGTRKALRRKKEPRSLVGGMPHRLASLLSQP